MFQGYPDFCIFIKLFYVPSKDGSRMIAGLGGVGL